MNLYKHLFFICLFVFNNSGVSQMTVTTNTMTVEQYIQNVLLGGGVTISNVQFNGGSACY